MQDRTVASTVTLVILFGLVSAVFPGDAVRVEGESFSGTNLTIGFDRGVMYMTPGTNLAEGKVAVPVADRYAIYARIYSAWAGRKGNFLTIRIGAKEFLAGSTNEHPFRWDAGSYQVWHWLKVGEADIAPGDRITVTGSEWLDQLVLHKGGNAWLEPWLAGNEAVLAGAPCTTPSKGDIVFPPDEWVVAGDAGIQRLADLPIPGVRGEPAATRACRLQGPSDAALRRFLLTADGRFEVWARLYFYNKNMFEGRTMEEMQHCTYVMIDGCLHGTVVEQNRRRWTWYNLGMVDLKKGEHLVAVAHRGAPVLVGEVTLKRSAAEVEQCDWYVRPLPDAMPFGIAGGDPLAAKRAGQWLMRGALAGGATGKWLGETVEDRPQVVEIGMPQQAGTLVLEANWPIECSVVVEPQMISFQCKGDMEGLTFKAVVLDRTGYSRLWPCKVTKDKDGWNSVYCFLAPQQTAGANLVALGNSARPPDSDEPGNPLFRAPVVVPSEKQPVLPEWGVMELTHVVIESSGKSADRLLLSEPAFSAPITAAGAGRVHEKQAQVDIALRNAATVPLDVELHVQAGPLAENVSEEERGRRWRRFVTAVPANGVQDAKVRLPVPPGGAYWVSYRVGLGDIKRLRLLAGMEAKPLLERELARAMDGNCAFESPTWKRGFDRGAVVGKYGKDFRIRVGGLDVTTLEYAEQHNALKPFRVVGRDLADGAGWPEVHVAPGTVAFDPQLGRIKFAEGYRGPCEVVGSFRTGFGVPGGGAPVFYGQYALTPGGEGNYSVFDIGRGDRPIPAGMIPSWYFEHDAHKLDNYLFFNSSHRGFNVVDDLSNPTRPGTIRRVELDVERYGRVSVVAEKGRFLICDRGQDHGISIFSLEDPLRPRFQASLAQCWGPLPTRWDGKYIVRTVNGLAILSVNDPRRPVLSAAWRPDGEAWKSFAILAVDEPESKTPAGRIACRLADVEIETDAKTEKRAVIACLEYDEHGFRQLGRPCTDVPAVNSVVAAFYRDYLYLLNGHNGAGQYSLSLRSPHSAFHTFRIEEGTIRKAGDPIVDEYPSAYSQVRIHDGKAYVTDYNVGMLAFDLADPAKPRKVTRYYGAAEGDALFVQDGRAYFWQTFGGQTYVIDCAVPAAPVCRAVYWDGAWVAYQNRFRGLNTIWGKDHVVYSARCGVGLAILDARNPSAPRMIGALNPDTNRVFGSCNFRVRGDLLAVSQVEPVLVDGKSESRHKVRLYDVKSPENPRFLGDAVAQAGDALYWVGNRLFLASGKWLSILDTSNPAQPRIMSATDLQSNLPEFGDATVCGIAVAGNVAYLAARGGGRDQALMVLVDVSKPQSPKPVRIFDSVTDYLPTECGECWANFYEDIEIRDQMMFVASYGRIECFDISEPLMPRLVAQRAIGFQWSLGMLEGDYLYVPGLAEFILLQVPSSPQRPKGEITVE